MAQKKKIDEAASVGEGGNGVFLDNLWQVYALGVSLWYLGSFDSAFVSRFARRSSAVSCEVELASCETRNVSEFYKAERSTDFLLAVLLTFNGLPLARSLLTLLRAHACVVRAVYLVCSCILIFLSSLSPITRVLHFLCSSCDDSWRYGSD